MYTIDAHKTLERIQNCPLPPEEAKLVVGYQTAYHDQSKGTVRWVAYI